MNSSDLEQKRDELLFVARMNVHLHQGRERYYASFMRWTSALSLLLSSAAFAAVGNLLPESLPITKEGLIAWFSLLVTLFNAIQLAFGFPNKVQTHAAFKRKWMELESQLKSIDLTSSDAAQLLKEIETKAYLLHGDEPPISEIVKREAFNYAVQSLGYEKSHKIPILFRR